MLDTALGSTGGGSPSVGTPGPGAHRKCSSDAVYKIGSCTIDTSSYEIRRNGEPIAVEPQVFDLLVLLAQNPDRVVTKDEIIEQVWRGRCVTDGAISTRVMAARQAIGDDGGAQKFIRTVRGRGFRLVGASREDTVVNVPKPRRCERPSVAVLPFANLSGDPLQAYLSDGITEDVITELSRFRSLAVAARNSSFRLRDTSANIHQIAQELQVDYVLEGSVRKLGERLRITVQLVDARTEHHVWAERYDRPLAEIFDVQDEISSSIVTALWGEISSATLAQARARPHTDWRAYDHYLMARWWSQLARTAANVTKVMTCAEAAVALDPTYAPGHSMMANAFRWRSVLVSLGDTERVRDDYRCSLESALKAVSLNANNAETLRALGWSHMCHRNYADAERFLQRSYALNPHDGDVAMSWVTALTYLGHAERAIELGERTVERLAHPPDYCSFDLGEAHFFAGHYPEAAALFDRTPDEELDESIVTVISAYAHAGDMSSTHRHSARYREALMRDWDGDPNASIAERIAWEFEFRHFYRRPADIERLHAGLHDAGL